MLYAAKSFDIGHVAHLLPDTRDIYVRCVCVSYVARKNYEALLLYCQHTSHQHTIYYMRVYSQSLTKIIIQSNGRLSECLHNGLARNQNPINSHLVDEAAAVAAVESRQRCI